MNAFDLETLTTILEELAGVLYGFSVIDNMDCPLLDDGLLTPAGKRLLRTAAPLAMEADKAVWEIEHKSPDETNETLLLISDYFRSLHLTLRYLGEHAGEVEDEALQARELYWGVYRHLEVVQSLRPSPEPVEAAS